jgi:beta-glucosidase
VTFGLNRLWLAGFKRVHLQPGESRALEFPIRPEQLALVNAQGRRVPVVGRLRLWLGGCQPLFDARDDGILTTELDVLEMEGV